MNFQAYSLWSTKRVIVTWEDPEIQVGLYRRELSQKGFESNFPSIESVL